QRGGEEHAPPAGFDDLRGKAPRPDTSSIGQPDADPAVRDTAGAAAASEAAETREDQPHDHRDGGRIPEPEERKSGCSQHRDRDEDTQDEASVQRGTTVRAAPDASRRAPELAEIL